MELWHKKWHISFILLGSIEWIPAFAKDFYYYVTGACGLIVRVKN